MYGDCNGQQLPQNFSWASKVVVTNWCHFTRSNSCGFSLVVIMLFTIGLLPNDVSNGGRTSVTRSQNSSRPLCIRIWEQPVSLSANAVSAWLHSKDFFPRYICLGRSSNLTFKVACFYGRLFSKIARKVQLTMAISVIKEKSAWGQNWQKLQNTSSMEYINLCVENLG